VPALSDRCRNNDQYCCICEQNECSVALPGEVILFVDGEEVVTTGKRCDCIAVIKRVKVVGKEATYLLEIFAVELKSIREFEDEKTEALKPDSLRQKCHNCLSWAQGIVMKFNTVMKNPKRATVEGHCVVAVPANVLTLAKRKLPRPKDVLVIACGKPLAQIA